MGQLSNFIELLKSAKRSKSIKSVNIFQKSEQIHKFLYYLLLKSSLFPNF
nr:MAG TPA: hypothetical protein [Caudoviricetes sp.]DAY21798.1 MAG TPA: hypothetical protein [Caudoviricetes sp.]